MTRRGWANKMARAKGAGAVMDLLAKADNKVDAFRGFDAYAEIVGRKLAVENLKFGASYFLSGRQSRTMENRVRSWATKEESNAAN